MRKFLNALLYKKLISGEMQLTGEKCKPSKMQTFSKGTTLHNYYCNYVGVRIYQGIRMIKRSERRTNEQGLRLFWTVKISFSSSKIQL